MRIIGHALAHALVIPANPCITPGPLTQRHIPGLPNQIIPTKKLPVKKPTAPAE